MDYDAWILWAEVTNIHSTVLSFIKQRGNFAGSTADRWERISDLLKSKGNIDPALMLRIMRGIIGEPGTSLFYAFKQDVDAGKINLPILGLILPLGR